MVRRRIELVRIHPAAEPDRDNDEDAGQRRMAGCLAFEATGAPDVAGLRVDLMSRLREMDGFDQLWQRRTTIEAEEQAIDPVQETAMPRQDRATVLHAPLPFHPAFE